MLAVLVSAALIAQAVGATTIASAERLGDASRQGVEPAPPPDNPLRPPPGSTVVDQTADRIVFRDSATDATTARVFGQAVAYQDQTGAWQPLDNTLEAGRGGGYVNAAGPIHLNFASSSSAQKLVQLTDGDSSVSFQLQGAGETKPRANANTITYPNVLDGVDLSYSLVAAKLKEMLTLSRPPAGSDPVVYDFPLQLQGLTPRTADNGEIELVDAERRVAFSIPQGVAVDSSSDDLGDPARSRVGVSLSGDADSGWSIELLPDSDWLRSPDRTYPVDVDPSYTWTAGVGATGSSGYDAYVSSTAPNANFDGSAQWNGTNFVDEASATSSVRSSDLYYDLSWLSGRSVTAASWNGYVVLGTSFPSGYQLQPLAGSWTESSVTWNTQPGLITGAAVTGSAAFVNAWSSNSITSWVQNWATGAWTNNGVVLSHTGSGTNLRFAADESSSNASYIQVSYDSYPTTPDMRQPAPGVSTEDITPQLSGRVKDPDGGNVAGDFELWTASTGGSLVAWGSGTTVDSASRSLWTAPPLTNGTTYWWDVIADDGTLQSAATARRSLKVDTTAPNTPGISSSTYVASSWSSATSGPFTFSAGGSSDVVGWYYGFNDQNPDTNYTPIATSTVTLAPPPGWSDLDVRSIDAAGNVSALATFSLGIGSGGFESINDWPRAHTSLELTPDSGLSFDGFALQYRRADNEPWSLVPVGDVTIKSSSSSVSAWPVSTYSGSPDRVYSTVVWDAATSLTSDGPLEVRAIYYTGSTQTSSTTPALHAVLDGSLGASSTVQIGLGEADPTNGNFALPSSDVSVGTLGITRWMNSRSVGASSPALGPGWNLGPDADSVPYIALHPVNGGDAVEIDSANNARELGFYLNASGTTYLPDSDAAGALLTQPDSSHFDFTDAEGVSVVFTLPTGAAYWTPQSVTQPGRSSSTTLGWTTAGSGAELTKLTAAPSDGVTCSGSTLNAGCRQLTLSYATSTTATGTAEAQWGDYNGAVQIVRYKAWDDSLSTPAINTVGVAKYLYDSNGRLRAEWDPRIGVTDKTRYSYNSNGELSTLTTPGMNAWSFQYTTTSTDPNVGRLASVSRPGVPTGTETITMVYGVPLSGSGAPYDLSASEYSRWDETDTPVYASAVFPPDEVPSSSPPSNYDDATVYYTDLNGRVVNVASPSPSGCATDSSKCDIATAAYDAFGNETRNLTPNNRATALSASTIDPSYIEAHSSILLSTQSIYSADGTNLVDMYGPAHAVTQPPPNDNELITARRHQHFDYDQGAPTGVCPCHLSTTSTDGAAPVDGSADVDIRTTQNQYDLGADTSGWTLREALRTVQDPAGEDLASTTLYDHDSGQLIEGRTPANPSGGDAHSTLTIYYTSGSNTRATLCGYKPEWADLECLIEPAAQPGTSGLPDLTNTLVTDYNMWDEPLASSVTDSGGAAETATQTYDSAGRQQTTATSTTDGTAIPTITTAYDSTTQLPTTTIEGTQTIARAWDADGRLATYTDADGNATTYSYDLADRITSINDGKATDTISYHDGGERREFPTKLSDPVAGDIVATYDADGNLSSRAYPGGLTAETAYDAAGMQTGLTYSRSGSTWISETDTYDVHNELTDRADAWSNQTESYDAAGRSLLISSAPSGAGCISMQTGYDADSNHATGTVYDANPDSSCNTSSGATSTSTFDAGDRPTAAGYSYDTLDRVTTVPASQTLTGVPVSYTYFADDSVRTVTSAGVTTTNGRDPNGRVRSVDDGVNSLVHHFASDDDKPDWVTTDSSGTTWLRNLAGLGTDTNVDNAGVVTFALTDIEGDVIATAGPSSTGPNFASPFSIVDVEAPTSTTMSFTPPNPCPGTTQQYQLIVHYSHDVHNYYLRCGPPPPSNPSWGYRHILARHHWGGVLNDWTVSWVWPQILFKGIWSIKSSRVVDLAWGWLYHDGEGRVLWGFVGAIETNRTAPYSDGNITTSWNDFDFSLVPTRPVGSDGCWDEDGPC